MAEQNTENRKTVSEIQTQISKLKESVKNKETQIEAYRTKRAEINVNEADTQKNKAKVTSIDAEIRKLQKAIDNFPAELALLEENLAKEQHRLAQEENDKLLDLQREAANDVELLSKGFIVSLEKSVESNSQLRAALSAETSLREKTGVTILENYCHGSMQSLGMLLETMQAQMNGQHTQLVGPGTVPSATPIQL